MKELELLLAHREATSHSKGALGKEKETFQKVCASWHHIRKISTKIFAIRNPVGSVEAARLMEEMDYKWAYPATALLGQWSMAAVKEYINTEKSGQYSMEKGIGGHVFNIRRNFVSGHRFCLFHLQSDSQTYTNYSRPRENYIKR